jgi:membrane protease YdiL (CAAX protease family)
MEPLNDQPGLPPEQQIFDPQAEPSSGQRGIAPVWHTLVLILLIAGVSLLGFHRHPGGAGIGSANRMQTYGLTACLEFVLMGWVLLGLRLRRTPLRSVIGTVSNGFRSIALDAGIALLFWLGSLMALAMVALMWISIQMAITHKPLVRTGPGGRPTIANSNDEQAEHAVVQLAPANGKEIVCWLLMCVLVGFTEELVFRGYFQTQFARWARGAVWAGVVFSALMFGAAHGYEGVRAMFLLSVFGSFFSLLVLFRRNLRAAMFAHGWHDAFVGVLVSVLHAHHFL